MAEERIQRRLAAILAADVVGYSHLIEQDEAGTLAVLKERRRSILEPLVADHHGRIVKVMGDGVLVEFASIVSAVECAVKLQERMAAANTSSPKDREILLRIGIALGDVVVEGGDLYGHGVNLAARLETLAEPGGVCLSETAYQQVYRKLDLSYTDLGQQRLKNIADPVHVYSIAGACAGRTVGDPGPMFDEKLTVAVLPFANMGGNPEQAYLADGIADDLLTELARFRELSVAARNASFVYRDKTVAPQQIGRELGVQYLLEGSLRKAGDRVRINVQFIDAATGAHVWAERYDRDMQDIFDVQDEITGTIVETLLGKIASTTAERAKRKPPSDWRAYDCYLMGSELYLTQTKESMTQAIHYFQKAVDIDPQYARAFSRLCSSYGRMAQLFLKGDHDAYAKALAYARENVLKALSLDSSDAVALEALGWVCMRMRSIGEAEHLIGRAHRLNPHDGDIAMGYVTCLSYVGKPEQAIALAEMTIRRNPRHPQYYLFDLAEAHFFARHHEEAAELFDKLPDQLLAENRGMVAAAYAHAGRMDQARRHAESYVAELRASWTGDPADDLREHLKWEFQYRHTYKRPEDVAHLREGLRKAGLPE
jgi:adenylate cyclase